jgi:hypothetical protein
MQASMSSAHALLCLRPAALLCQRGILVRLVRPTLLGAASEIVTASRRRPLPHGRPSQAAALRCSRTPRAWSAQSEAYVCARKADSGRPRRVGYLPSTRARPRRWASIASRRRTVSAISQNIGGQSPTKMARRSALSLSSSPTVLARIHSTTHSAIVASEPACRYSLRGTTGAGGRDASSGGQLDASASVRAEGVALVRCHLDSVEPSDSGRPRAGRSG